MHRSGTSVLTHLLAGMGFDPGPPESLQPGDAANPQGYWESRAAWALDEEVLAALGASWWEVADLDLGALAPADRERFTARAKAIVGELDAHRPWVLKEPRMCVLLPLWQQVLSAPAYALVHRDPLEVARSLQARDGFPIAVGLALWEVYAIAALRHSQGAPRVPVSYHRLVRDPARVAAELAAQLQPLLGSPLRPPAASDLAAVVRPELHHQRSRDHEACGYLSAAQQRLAAALADGSALRWSEVPAPSAGSLELLRWFAVAERERRDLPDLRHRVETAEAEASWRRDRDVDHTRWNSDLRASLSRAEAAAGAAEPELARLQQRVAEVSRYNEDLAPRLAAAEEELTRLRARDAEISSWNETLTAQLADLRTAVERLQAEHEALQHLAEQRGRQSEELRVTLERLQAEHEALQRLAEQRGRQSTELRAAVERSGAALREARHAYAAVNQLLGDVIGYADRCWDQAVAFDRLVEQVLGSRTWSVGRALTAPLRRRHGDPSAEYQHTELRADAETLAAQRRDVARRSAHWGGGLPLPPPGDSDE
jgi:predicted  nucleic acid-binding Zn-ribbon protein